MLPFFKIAMENLLLQNVVKAIENDDLVSPVPHQTRGNADGVVGEKFEGTV